MRRANLFLIIALAGTAMLAGCAAPLLGSSVAGAGYGVAHGPLGDVFGSSASADTARGRDARQLKLQGVLNAVQVGQDAAPVLRAMGEPPKEKSGNPQGYTCYEFPAVYSATAAAVIVARNGKVVFFGNSHCVAEMQEANFRAGGKYAVPVGEPAAAGGAGNSGNGTLGAGSGTPSAGGPAAAGGGKADAHGQEAGSGDSGSGAQGAGSDGSNADTQAAGGVHGSDTGKGDGIDKGANIDKGIGTDKGAATDTGANADKGTNADKSTSTDKGAATGTGANTDKGTNADEGTGTDKGAGADNGVNTDKGASTGNEGVTGSDGAGSSSAAGSGSAGSSHSGSGNSPAQ